jgi:pimeloyl-ACP methyl ester carboxylesterase
MLAVSQQTDCPTFTVEHPTVAQTQLPVFRGGSGRPLLVLHGIEGHEGWLAFHEALSASATVYAPSHPGYGHTERPAWLTSVAHQAVFYHWFLQEAGLTAVDVVGVGVGGWIAAQMAIQCGGPLRSLVLVDAAGIRPAQGEITDVFVMPWRQVIEQSFADAPRAPEFERIYRAAPIAEFGGVREAGRTMSMRMCFKPYMFDPALPGMLGKIQTPTLVIWGNADRIVPLECAKLYQQAIPGARLEVIDNCGHFAHLDRPDALAKLVADFVGGSAR